MDIASETNRREAAIKAMDTGETNITGPITLVQATGAAQQSFLILSPIYRGGVTPPTREERRTQLYGWSYAPLLIQEVFDHLSFIQTDITLNISDVTDSPQIFYSSEPKSTQPGAIAALLRRTVFGREWQFSFEAKPTFVERLHQISPVLVFWVGAIFSGLGALLVWLQQAGAARKKEIDAQNANIAALVEGSHDGIIGQTLEGLVTSWNQGAELMFGFTPAEVLGKPLVELIVPTDRLHEDKEILAKARLGESLRNLVTQRHDKYGKQLDVSVTASPIRDGSGKLIGSSKTIRDISTLVIAERKIKEVNQELEMQVRDRTLELAATRDHLLLASDVAGLGVWVWHIDSDSLQWNDRMYELYGYSNELKQQGLNYTHWASRLHPEDAQQTTTLLADAVAGHGTYDCVFRIILPGGAIKYIKAAAHIERTSDGKPLKVKGINLNVTDQQELEQYLSQAKADAEAASLAKSSFLANMSHEIRTPMNAILGLLQLLSKSQLDMRQNDYIVKATQAAKSLLNLLNDILDYSKIESGKLELDIKPFSLDELMKELAIILAGNQAQKPVEILYDIASNIPMRLFGDAFRIKQILINLSGNALKFTESGQVVVQVTKLKSDDSHIALRFSVQDSGIGITQAQQQRIFEGFTQAEHSTARRFGGTGLGLVISRRLANLMGSDIKLESELGRGSRFWFDLDLSVCSTGQKQSGVTDLPESLRVLIVDDNEVAREIYTSNVKEMGLQVGCAEDGQSAKVALRKACEDRTPYGLILLDWLMPDMKGDKVAQDVEKDDSIMPKPLVLITTAYGSDALGSIRANSGGLIQGVVNKPTTPSQLREAIAAAVIGKDPEASKQEPVLKRLVGVRVLVVEDNALNRQVISELLQHEGALVSLAINGEEGVKAAVSNPEAYDVIIMDMQMPIMDGLEATRRIRADERLQSMPIVAMTANASEADKDLCLSAGMNEFITKPVDIDQLVSVLPNSTTSQDLEPTQSPFNDFDEEPLIEPLDILLKRYAGNVSILSRIIHQFKVDLGALMDDLLNAMSNTDPAAIASVLHAIKGSAATAGALKLSRIAAHMESDVKQGERVAISEIEYSTLHNVLKESDKELLALSSRLDPSESIKKPNILPEANSLRLFQELAQQLIPLLQSGKLSAIDIANKLPRPPQIDPDDFEDFLIHTQTLEFEDSERILRDWLERFKKI